MVAGMEQAQSTGPTRKRASARGRHLLASRRLRVTHQYERKRRSVAGMAADALFPWPMFAYPGRNGGILVLLRGRVSASAWKQWSHGGRRAPQWALVLLAAAIERRIAELAHVLELVRVEAAAREPKAKPGDGTGQP
jgi:hypothetical protein